MAQVKRGSLSGGANGGERQFIIKCIKHLSPTPRTPSRLMLPRGNNGAGAQDDIFLKIGGETGSGNQYSISLSFPPRRSPAGAQPGAGKRGSQWEAVRAQCRGLGKPPSLVSCVGDAREKGSESNIQSNTDLQRTTGTTNREASMKADRQAGFPSAQAERALVSRIMRDLPRRCSRSFGDMNFDLTGDLSFL